MSDKDTNNPTSSHPPAGQTGILDQIMGTKTQNSLNDFQPVSLVNELMGSLKERDKEILSKRFGLSGSEIETLEAIGKKHNLTRERVRQIEKDSLNTLKKKHQGAHEKALQLIFETITEHGNFMSEELLMQIILQNKPDQEEMNAVKFLLYLGEQFQNFKESPEFFESWYIIGFDFAKLDRIIKEYTAILESEGHVLTELSLHQRFKQTSYFKEHELELNDRVLHSYLNASKAIQINPFDEIGLKHWSDVKPRDVGDKAYLVMRHHKKPEHYSVITKLINDNKFDNRVAYQETVHNELIKDIRFVLIGRGIYALSEWGYTKGVVADVIREILKSFGRPLTRDEIITEVMKRRLVKRNTILVGLSNRKNFQKVGKDKYALSQGEPVN
ncbi:MAG: sigma factor-like helix-turn-helix DNA-binding protein [Candidatus Doudnabacteria bacterium]